MSDYQTVTVKKKKANVVTLEVVEDNPDVGALAAVIKAGKLKAGADAIKLGAMLLLEDKARGGDIFPPEDESPAPEQFVSGIKLVVAEEIGKDVNGDPRFRATLEIKVKRKADAALFKVGDSWGAVALLGGDFDDMFG